MLKNKVIESSTSPYTLNIVILRKKNEVCKGIKRMCINYAFLNEVIKKDSKPILIIKEYLLFFYKVKWLTVFDLELAYQQILLTKRSQKYTAFLIVYGLYQFQVMSFDLVNISAIF